MSAWNQVWTETIADLMTVHFSPVRTLFRGPHLGLYKTGTQERPPVTLLTLASFHSQEQRHYKLNQAWEAVVVS